MPKFGAGLESMSKYNGTLFPFMKWLNQIKNHMPDIEINTITISA